MFFNEAVEVVLQLKKYFKRYWREKLLSNCCTRVNTARESEWTWKSQTTKHGCYLKSTHHKQNPHTHTLFYEFAWAFVTKSVLISDPTFSLCNFVKLCLLSVLQQNLSKWVSADFCVCDADPHGETHLQQSSLSPPIIKKDIIFKECFKKKVVWTPLYQISCYICKGKKVAYNI